MSWRNLMTPNDDKFINKSQLQDNNSIKKNIEMEIQQNYSTISNSCKYSNENEENDKQIYQQFIQQIQVNNENSKENGKQLLSNNKEQNSQDFNNNNDLSEQFSNSSDNFEEELNNNLQSHKNQKNRFFHVKTPSYIADSKNVTPYQQTQKNNEKLKDIQQQQPIEQIKLSLNFQQEQNSDYKKVKNETSKQSDLNDKLIQSSVQNSNNNKKLDQYERVQQQNYQKLINNYKQMSIKEEQKKNSHNNIMDSPLIQKIKQRDQNSASGNKSGYKIKLEKIKGEMNQLKEKLNRFPKSHSINFLKSQGQLQGLNKDDNSDNLTHQLTIEKQRRKQMEQELMDSKQEINSLKNQLGKFEKEMENIKSMMFSSQKTSKKVSPTYQDVYTLQKDYFLNDEENILFDIQEKQNNNYKVETFNSQERQMHSPEFMIEEKQNDLKQLQNKKEIKNFSPKQNKNDNVLEILQQKQEKFYDNDDNKKEKSNIQNHFDQVNLNQKDQSNLFQEATPNRSNNISNFQETKIVFCKSTSGKKKQSDISQQQINSNQKFRKYSVSNDSPSIQKNDNYLNKYKQLNQVSSAKKDFNTKDSPLLKKKEQNAQNNIYQNLKSVQQQEIQSLENNNIKNSLSQIKKLFNSQDEQTQINQNQNNVNIFSETGKHYQELQNLKVSKNQLISTLEHIIYTIKNNEEFQSLSQSQNSHKKSQNQQEKNIEAQIYVLKNFRSQFNRKVEEIQQEMKQLKLFKPLKISGTQNIDSYQNQNLQQKNQDQSKSSNSPIQNNLNNLNNLFKNISNTTSNTNINNNQISYNLSNQGSYINSFYDNLAETLDFLKKSQNQNQNERHDLSFLQKLQAQNSDKNQINIHKNDKKDPIQIMENWTHDLKN